MQSGQLFVQARHRKFERLAGRQHPRYFLGNFRRHLGRRLPRSIPGGPAWGCPGSAYSIGDFQRNRSGRGTIPVFMQEQSEIGRRPSARAHALSLEIAAEARAEWGFAADILARAFRERRDLASSDRRMVAETVYGLLRWERRLEAIVEEMLSSSRGRRDIIS